MIQEKDQKWLRLYMRLMDDEDVMGLSDAEFKTWIFCLLTTKANGGVLPPNKTIAFKLRRKESVIEQHVATITQATLLTEINGELQPTGWKKLQFDSDVSTDRVRRFRNAKRNGGETFPKRPQRIELEKEKETPLPPFVDPGSLPDEQTPERWAERFREVHPKSSPIRPVQEFCSDHWHRLGDAEKFNVFMAEVLAGLEHWREFWLANGVQFAEKLPVWLNSEGWRKAPPVIGGKRKSNMDLLEEQYAAEEASKRAH